MAIVWASTIALEFEWKEVLWVSDAKKDVQQIYQLQILVCGIPVTRSFSSNTFSTLILGILNGKGETPITWLTKQPSYVFPLSRILILILLSLFV